MSPHRDRVPPAAGAPAPGPAAPDPAATAALRAKLWADLLASAEGRGLEWDRDLVERAFAFAWDRHAGQARASGEPYMVHPVAVARTIADMKLDDTAIVAALLHDTVEDTATTLDELAAGWGEETAQLVDGLTKIERIQSDPSSSHHSAENIRKVLFAMTRDIRVIFIKLADRLHNMSTLQHLPPERQEAIARETIDVYAPLANRLGIGWIKNELEDLALKHLDPAAYYELKSKVEERRAERAAYVERVIAGLKRQLAEQDMHFEILGRAKHFYSIYQKMGDKEKAFEDVFDLAAIRIITDKIPDCYQVLGVIHSLYRPLYDRFKDYIALPKSNMYSSLHTTVLGPEGKLLEVQIRTREMDIIAEEGAASHLLYKGGPVPKRELGAHLAWLSKLKLWQQSVSDPQHFMEEIREDLFQDEIYVFTPKGDVIRLGKGSTPIDFAYHIHTDVGHHTIGARVNGKMVPLKHELKNCDIVEVLTSRSAHPSTSWLRFVRSTRAKAKIRAHLNAFLDAEHLAKEVEKKSPGPPPAPAPQPRKEPRAEHPGKPRVYLSGEQQLLFEFARCCNPSPGDGILGYISRGRGIVIHRRDCKNVPHLFREEGRIVYPTWKQAEASFRGKIAVAVAEDRYILAEVVSLVSSNNASITAVRRTPLPEGRMRIDLELEVTGRAAWELIESALAAAPKVEEVLESGVEALGPGA